MDFALVLIGINIHLIFLFKREWLFDKKIFRGILLANVVLFILSYMLQLSDIGNPKFTLVLKVPLLSQLIFWTMRGLYFKIFNANPQDSFWTMDIKLMKDGIFNFLFWVIGLMLPMILIYKILP